MFSEPEARTRALSWKLSLNIVQLGSKIHAATRATGTPDNQTMSQENIAVYNST
jgi:hypothetical protein